MYRESTESSFILLTLLRTCQLKGFDRLLHSVIFRSVHSRFVVYRETLPEVWPDQLPIASSNPRPPLRLMDVDEPPPGTGLTLQNVHKRRSLALGPIGFVTHSLYSCGGGPASLSVRLSHHTALTTGPFRALSRDTLRFEADASGPPPDKRTRLDDSHVTLSMPCSHLYLLFLFFFYGVGHIGDIHELRRWWAWGFSSSGSW